MSRRLELNLNKVKERSHGRIFGGLLALTIALSFSGCGAVEISFETPGSRPDMFRSESAAWDSLEPRSVRRVRSGLVNWILRSLQR